jgi:signal transduction histidine kinase
MGRLRRRLEHVLRSSAGRDELLERVDESLADLDQIVETFEALLRITQIEAGARKEKFCEVDLASVLADVVDVYEPVVEEAGDMLQNHLAAGPATVHGDRELLIQLFANLVENSIRHSPAGTAMGVELSAVDGRHAATVWDTGPGIPEDEREKVFRRLYRLEKSRTTPGSGLGLSLVLAIAELHGAKVDLQDNGPGLRICVLFPKPVGAV